MAATSIWSVKGWLGKVMIYSPLRFTLARNASASCSFNRNINGIFRLLTGPSPSLFVWIPAPAGAFCFLYRTHRSFQMEDGSFRITEESMFILTNERKVDGAAVIAFPGVMDKLDECIDQPYTEIPLYPVIFTDVAVAVGNTGFHAIFRKDV